MTTAGEPGADGADDGGVIAGERAAMGGTTPIPAPNTGMPGIGPPYGLSMLGWIGMACMAGDPGDAASPPRAAAVAPDEGDLSPLRFFFSFLLDFFRFPALSGGECPGAALPVTVGCEPSATSGRIGGAGASFGAANTNHHTDLKHMRPFGSTCKTSPRKTPQNHPSTLCSHCPNQEDDPSSPSAIAEHASQSHS